MFGVSSEPQTAWQLVKGSGMLPSSVNRLIDLIACTVICQSNCPATPPSPGTFDLRHLPDRLGAQGHASRHGPVANPRRLSIALCVDGVPVYDAADCALTARCPLAQPYPFPFSTA